MIYKLVCQWVETTKYKQKNCYWNQKKKTGQFNVELLEIIAICAINFDFYESNWHTDEEANKWKYHFHK